MPAPKKASAPDAKTIYLKGRIIETKAQVEGPRYWIFEEHGRDPFIGVGSGPEASNYARLLNLHRTNHLSVRPLSTAEAEALSATVLAAAINGDRPPTFNIAADMARLHG